MPGLFEFNKQKEKVRFDKLDWPYINSGKEKSEEYLMQKFAFSSPFHASCMYRVKQLKKINFFYDANYSYFSDIDLNLRILMESDFIYLKEMLIGVSKRESSHQLNFRDIESLRILYDINLKFLNSLKKKNFNVLEFLYAKTNSQLNQLMTNASLKGFGYFKEKETEILIYFPHFKIKFYRFPNVVKFCLYFFQYFLSKFKQKCMALNQ